MVGYYQCLDCNYQFLTENDSYCPKCGIRNPKYVDGGLEKQELLNLITKINDNINARVNEISLKIDKIEKQLRSVLI